MPMIIDSATVSHEGNHRQHNEDAYFVSQEKGIWCVADGMGGYAAGEVASAQVVQAVASTPIDGVLENTLNAVAASLHDVNENMVQAEKQGLQPAMGSTVLVLLVQGNNSGCLWAGDSRLYLYRDALLYQMSKDHSLVQEWADQGVISPQEMDNHPRGHVITRAVGAGPDLELDRIYFELQPMDQLLLCSDGLYNELSPEEISAALGLHDSLQAKAQYLMQQVLLKEAKDNVTISILQCCDAL